MNANDPLASVEPVIEADLGTNGGKVSFNSIAEASHWIMQEIELWDNRLTNAPDDDYTTIMNQLKVKERQLHLPMKIKELLYSTRSFTKDGKPADFQEISKLFGQYANYHSLCSKSESGTMIAGILSNKTQFYYFAIGRLIGMLRVPLEEVLEVTRDTILPFQSAENGILLGYTTFATMDFLGKPDVLGQMDRLEVVIRQAEDTSKEIIERGRKINEEAVAELEGHRSEWNEFLETAEKERKGLEEAFKEHVRLDAPATYWREQAASASKTAKRALAAFLAGALAVVVLSIVFGPGLLERLATVDGAGSFAPLALVSIPALTALWGLRHAARLFVANLERSADARTRETMATTFLALTKEQGDIGKEERLLVLEALFRPPAAARTDDGHFGGALEILTRRNPSA